MLFLCYSPIVFSISLKKGGYSETLHLLFFCHFGSIFGKKEVYLGIYFL